MDDSYRFRLGDFDCVALRDASRSTTLGQVFPAVSRADLDRALAEEPGLGEEIDVGFNCLLVDTGRKRLLVDTGSGQGRLADSLGAAGYRPSEIDTIVLTHGDGDHIGGIGRFPGARFVMTVQAWELWTNPETRARMVEEFIALFRNGPSEAELAARAAQREAYGRDLLPSLRDRIRLVEPETEFEPGFSLIAAPGHRSDHTAVEIRSRGETLLHVVDGIRHPLQARRPEWTSYIDSDPERTVASNRRLLERAARSNGLVFGAHLPFPGLGRVHRDGGAWSWEVVAG